MDACCNIAPCDARSGCTFTKNLCDFTQHAVFKAPSASFPSARLLVRRRKFKAK